MKEGVYWYASLLSEILVVSFFFEETSRTAVPPSTDLLSRPLKGGFLPL